MSGVPVPLLMGNDPVVPLTEDELEIIRAELEISAARYTHDQRRQRALRWRQLLRRLGIPEREEFPGVAMYKRDQLVMDSGAVLIFDEEERTGRVRNGCEACGAPESAWRGMNYLCPDCLRRWQNHEAMPIVELIKARAGL